MRNSNLKLVITAAFLAGTIGTFSAFAHEGEGKGMMSSDNKGMMSSEGMQGMGGMMEMMSDMAPEDRKTMMKACMNMMQSHSSDMGADKDGNSGDQ